MSLYLRYTSGWKHETVFHGLNKNSIIIVLLLVLITISMILIESKQKVSFTETGNFKPGLGRYRWAVLATWKAEAGG